jgi:microcystin degradation protein MlrC
MDVGGSVDESAGRPVRIRGTVLDLGIAHGQFWAAIRFGNDNVLILTTYLTQIMEPSSLDGMGADLATFDVIALKSRVHFRRGFHDSGFAKTILLVEPDEPFLGTVRLDALTYENVDLSQFYPYGNPSFPPE